MTEGAIWASGGPDLGGSQLLRYPPLLREVPRARSSATPPSVKQALRKKNGVGAVKIFGGLFG